MYTHTRTHTHTYIGLYQEYLNIQILNNSIILMEFFLTPDLLDWRILIYIYNATENKNNDILQIFQLQSLLYGSMLFLKRVHMHARNHKYLIL